MLIGYFAVAQLLKESLVYYSKQALELWQSRRAITASVVSEQVLSNVRENALILHELEKGLE